ncbi:MAG: nickel pincer cofactor biosynthesis protein LarB [Calditrichaeota bacterium]|nr:nickel pincer cofactor biosynthesis protein LarB [Calditrichota bacterium]
MAQDPLKHLLEQFRNGELELDVVLKKLQQQFLGKLPFATLDFHRESRQGFPEVIFCQGKSLQQIVEIAREIYHRHHRFLATHASEAVYQALSEHISALEYHPQARCVYTHPPKPDPLGKHRAAIITAGTADTAVAEEAAIVLELFGYPPQKIYDVGVAGLHRLDAHWDNIQSASILIVVAGMEGALPSVVGGLVDKPIIAVPTSVGYGTQLNGLAALLAMLNSCANSISVVNIDNGFGAGFCAALMIRQMIHLVHQNREPKDG